MKDTWSDNREGIAVYNSAGSAVPPFGVMELDYNYESGKSATFVRDNETVFRIKQPTSSGVSDPARLLFNGPFEIPASQYGFGNLSPVCLATWDDTDGTPSIGDEVGAKASSWYLSVNGTGFRVKSFDSGNAYYVDAGTRTLWVEPIGSGGTSTKIIKTSAIAALSGTTVSSASCDVYKIVAGTLTDTGNNITVHNIWPFAIPANMYCKATKEAETGFWIITHPGVVDVQWNSPDLEKTYDGSTMINIDTAVTCT